jgi:hypothetical protein
MVHLAEGQCLNALLMLKAESLICLAGTQIPTVSIMERQFVLQSKHYYEKEHQDVIIWNEVF